MGYTFLNSDSIGLAYQCFKRSADLFPGEATTWHNIGKCFHEKQDDKAAEEFFRRALKIQPNFSNSLEGLSMCNLNKGEFGMAIEYANRALAEDPNATQSRTNRGMAYLALKRWKEGWRDYNSNIGTEKNRREIIYGSEPRWDGTKGLDVVTYCEQGLGDEIAFASCLPDLIRDCKSVTLECDGRLEKLFRRSFPGVEVHGTRYKKTPPEWRFKRKYDARVAIGKLPELYRRQDADFPDGKYLVPDPQKVMQWRTLLDSLGDKPKIGIAWQGGLPHTGRARRSVALDTFAPLFRYDATWVSLQYMESPEIKAAEEKYGVVINEWDWGTRVFDYDQTASLVSQLDLVISVTTAVVDLAGALGVECWCLVPSCSVWKHLHEGSWYPWAKSVTLYRQKGREWPIWNLLGKLKDKYGNRPLDGRSGSKEAAAQAA